MKLIKIHPAIHILYYLTLICFGMLYNNIYYLATFIVLILILLYLEGALSKLKDLFKIFIPFALIIIILNPLCSRVGVTKIYLFGNFYITLEALIFGIIGSISLFVVFMILLSYNEEVSYQEMLYIFSKKLPNVSMIIVMALRYIPLLKCRIKDFLKINSLDIEENNFSNKIEIGAKAFGGVIGWSLEDSMITAKSMKSRGYNITKRSSYLSFKFRTVDYGLLALIIIASAVCIYGLFLGVGRISIYPQFNFAFDKSPIDMFYIAFVVLLLPKILFEIRERLYWVGL